MRILNVTQSYAPFFEFGGPPVKVRALSEGMARKGHEVTVLTVDWGLQQRASSMAAQNPVEPGPFGRRQKVNGVTAIYLGNWWHYRAVSWNPAVGRFAKARLGEFDVAHIFGLYDLLGPRVAEECRKRKTPYVVEPIGMFLPIVRNLWLKGMYHRLWGRAMLEGANLIIATAEQERDELTAGGLPAGKIVLRRNGVEIPASFPERGEFRRELGIPEGEKLILFLGRLAQKKSPDLLLKAFAGLVRGRQPGEPGVHLAYVGPDESGMRARLQEMAEELGLSERVHLAGAREGAAKWSVYRDADAFVLPSQNENFGNTAAEAVVAGTPVVVTEQCGIAPILKDVAGLAVNHEEGQIRQALEKLLKDDALYKKLQDGCKKAVEKLGWQEPLEQMEVIYGGLARHSET